MVNVSQLISRCLEGYGIISSVFFDPSTNSLDILVGHENVTQYQEAMEWAAECAENYSNYSSRNIGSYTLLLGGYLNEDSRRHHDPELFADLPTYEEAERAASASMGDDVGGSEIDSRDLINRIKRDNNNDWSVLAYDSAKCNGQKLKYINDLCWISHSLYSKN